MLKILGSLIIILSFTYIGFSYGDDLKVRLTQLQEFQKGLYLLKNQIIYTYTSLPEAFEYISIKSQGEVKNIFKNISELLYDNKVKDVHDAFKITIEKHKNLKLKREDIDILFNLSKSLGKSDLEGQKSILLFTIDNLQKQVEDAEKVMKKNTKMYRYLGFSIGCMLVIMLL